MSPTAFVTYVIIIQDIKNANRGITNQIMHLSCSKDNILKQLTVNWLSISTCVPIQKFLCSTIKKKVYQNQAPVGGKCDVLRVIIDSNWLIKSTNICS